MLALITFLVVIAIVLSAARVGATALEATGMARDSAEFQARSALLGVGFTTSDRLARAHLRGNRDDSDRRAIRDTPGWNRRPPRLGSHVGANRIIAAATQAALRRFSQLDTTDFASLLRFDSDYAVTELTAHEGEWLPKITCWRTAERPRFASSPHGNVLLATRLTRSRPCGLQVDKPVDKRWTKPLLLGMGKKSCGQPWGFRKTP